MITFDNGPAKGKVLEVRRAPRFLRVVVSPSGEVDALDQIDDIAKADETIYVYWAPDGVNWIHLDGINRETDRRFGSTVPYANYSLYGTQPGEAVRRSEDWQKWATNEAAKGDACET